MKLWKEGIYSILKRYRDIWKSVWNIRDQLDPPVRDEDERAFLPAQLELIETPLSNAPKWTARCIILFFTIALLWSIWGHMEVVASAQGKTVLNRGSKVIKSLEDAGVIKIFVNNGDQVSAGDLLISLDFTGAEQDYKNAIASLEAATLQMYRSQALLTSLEQNIPPHIKVLPNDTITSKKLQQAEEIIKNQYHLWLAQDQRYSSAIRQVDSEYRAMELQTYKLEQTLKLLEEEVNDYKSLIENKGISKHQYNQKSQDLINIKHELASQESRLTGIKEGKIQLEKEQSSAKYQLRQQTLNNLRESLEMIPQYQTESERSQHRIKQANILAPVTGTVQQLKIHTEGGVVSHGEELMVIVPEGDLMEVEALIHNKDIGFIESDQEVIIKIESFPYTRYGYITGTVKSISLDAIEHQDYGLVYQSIIKLNKDYLTINDKDIALTAGMNVTAELKIRDRRIIDYFLSPLQTKIEESMREL